MYRWRKGKSYKHLQGTENSFLKQMSFFTSQELSHFIPWDLKKVQQSICQELQTTGWATLGSNFGRVHSTTTRFWVPRQYGRHNTSSKARWCNCAAWFTTPYGWNDWALDLPHGGSWYWGHLTLHIRHLPYAVQPRTNIHRLVLWSWSSYPHCPRDRFSVGLGGNMVNVDSFDS